MMAEQSTLSAACVFQGVGIHTGQECVVTVRPADPGAGRVFLVGGARIPAQAENIADTARSTTLAVGNVSARTVEHLLSALFALGLDNALIDVEGPEVPILDGSALPFVEAIQRAGIRKQECPARALHLKEPVAVEAGASRIAAVPADDFRLEVVTAFEEWVEGLARQEFRADADGPARYVAQIAPARTFAFRREVEMLLAAGLAQGGSLENALIVTPPDGFSSPLRVPQEWCAHKLLDVLGDLALVDARLAMHVTAIRPGHRINTQFARLLRERLAA